jgi:hypothetical protein
MKRRIVIGLLTFGVVAGYGAAFAHVHAWRHAHCGCPSQGVHGPIGGPGGPGEPGLQG